MSMSIVICFETVGKPKANVITACRDALRVKNIEAISRIIKSGAT